MDVENSQTLAQHNQESNWPRARIIQWVVTAAVVLVAEIAFFNGRTGISYLLDGVAVAVFFGLRKAREQGD
jgi:hypothetical protein